MKKASDVSSTWERSRILLGLLIIYAVFESAARTFGSYRGQAGLVVCAIVIAACLAVERALYGQRIAAAWRSLGLRLPVARGSIVAIGVVAALLLILLGIAQSAAVSLELTNDAFALVPGLFAQGGIAEEVLFRGYLYRHFRSRRSSRHAATLAMLPFAALHLLLFLSLPWHVALLAWLVSVALSFPLAHLFEISGHSIWPPALVHFVIQAVPKVTAVSNAPDSMFPIFWMLLTVVVLWLALATDHALRRKLKLETGFDAPFPRSGGPDDRDTEGRPYVLTKY